MGFAIINRSFWPESEVLGEAHLRFAEEASHIDTTSVIFQSSRDILNEIKKRRRGKGVKLRPCKRFTDSSSNLAIRMIETLYFMIWVFVGLVIERPKKVYVSTDPPVLVPFVVFFYAKIFKADYFYHLQDIHPEAANIVMPINRFVLSFLRYLDNLTMKNAKCLITISEDMQNFIYKRSGSETPIALLDNPAIDLGLTNTVNRDRDFIFIGNLGRLQRIPLLITSIKRYLEKNGSSNFTFVGGGVYSSQIQDLAQKFDAVEYLGKVSAKEAAEITSIHRWAILSINDEVTPLAFPSKSSSYVFSGCKILALCGNDTSVARWTVKHNLGLVALPNENSLVSCFFRLETEKWTKPNVSSELRKRLDINFFVNRLIQFCELKNV